MLDHPALMILRSLGPPSIASAVRLRSFRHQGSICLLRFTKQPLVSRVSSNTRGPGPLRAGRLARMTSTRERTCRFPPSSMPVPGPPYLFARDRHVDALEPGVRLDESLDAQPSRLAAAPEGREGGGANGRPWPGPP